MGVFMAISSRKLLLIPAVPGLALSGGFLLQACVSPRGGGGGGGGGDDDDAAASILGNWYLTRYGSYAYPSTYTYDGCTSTTTRRLTVEGDFDAEWRSDNVATGAGCSTAYDGSHTYDGTWEELAPGAWRMEFPDALATWTCTLDTDELECENADGTVLEFERS